MSNLSYSIIIPCFNTAKYIGKCLDSIFVNDMSQNELIIIDDGSSDSLIYYLESYFSFSIDNDLFHGKFSDCDITILRQKNHGVSYSRNQGIKLANKDYCLFVDPDDYISQSYISTLNLSLKALPVDMLLFGFDSYYEDLGNYKYESACRPIKIYDLKNNQEIKDTMIPLYIGRSVDHVRNWAKRGIFLPAMEHHAVWRIAYKRQFLIDSELSFPEDIFLNEDGIFNCRCFCKASSVSSINDSLYNYVKHTDSAVTGSKRKSRELISNKCNLLKERISILNTIAPHENTPNYSLITGATIFSIFEMLLLLPDEYKTVRDEYILEENVQKMIKLMPYVHKLVFDGPLFFLKHKLYYPLHLIFAVLSKLNKSYIKKFL